MNTHYKGTEQENLALSAWIKLARSYKSVFKIIKPTMIKNNLSRSQFGVLELLLHLGPMSQKNISDKLLRSSGNIVKVIDNLEKNSLVRREPIKTDRRANQIVLTELGRQVIISIFPNHVNKIVKAFSVLSKDEQVELGRLCKKLGKGLDDD